MTYAEIFLFNEFTEHLLLGQILLLGAEVTSENKT